MILTLKCLENLNRRCGLPFKCAWKHKFMWRDSENTGKVFILNRYIVLVKVKVKQSRYAPGVAPEGSRELRFPDFITTAQDGGKVVSLTHRPPLPPGNTPGTHFC